MSDRESDRREHELRVILDAIPAPVFYKDAAGVYRGGNQAWLDYLGKARDDIVGKDVYGVSPKELADVYKQADDDLFASRGTQIYEARVRYADGSYHDVVFHKATFADARGELAGLVGTMLDITSRKVAERALRDSEARWRAVVSALGEGIVVIGKGAGVLASNPAAARILRMTADELAAGAAWPLAHDDGSPLALDDTPIGLALATGAERDNIAIALRHRDGTRGWLALSTRVLAEQDAVVASFADVTERHTFVERLEHAAQHDALTGLPNRALFADHLDRALKLARRRDERVAIAFIDLDRFKDVNDTRGHAAGDRLLAEVAARLAGAVRESDLVARIGGDEFCAILPAVADADAVRAVAERMLAALAGASGVTASIGIALFPDHGAAGDELLRVADAAMYRVKGEGRNAIAIAVV